MCCQLSCEEKQAPFLYDLSAELVSFFFWYSIREAMAGTSARVTVSSSANNDRLAQLKDLMIESNTIG
jgi:hypothetical protein